MIAKGGYQSYDDYSTIGRHTYCLPDNLWQIDFELTEYESVVSSQDLVNHGQMNDENTVTSRHRTMTFKRLTTT